jgi:hypothetical protein
MNKLIGGLNTDVHPSHQPEHTVRDMKNFVPMDDVGNTMTLINEDGTTSMDVGIPSGFKIIGKSLLNTDIIVVLAHPNGYSQVGIIAEESGSFQYTAYAPYDADADSVPNDSDELGFNQNYPVDCVSRKLINGHRMLYYTDNNIPFGRIDIDEPPLVGDAADQSSLIPSTTIPEIDVLSINEPSASSIKPGVYQFITRYVTNSGGYTVFGIPTNVVPMVPTQKAEGVNNYRGDYNTGDIVNKSITVEISNIDQQFAEIELVVLYYEGNSNIFKSSRVATIPISSETLSYEFTGVNTEDALELTRAEIEQQVISYNTAKCIEQKDNYLFLSNLRANQVDTDILQQVANDVSVRYSMLEVPFSGRGDNIDGPDFFVLTSLPILSGTQTINLRFNKTPDVTLANNFEVESSGSPAKGSVEITDNSLLSPGDTITIGALGPQAAVVFTMVANGDPITGNEFNIGLDAEDTLVNLSVAINNSVDVISYYCEEPDTSIADVVWSTIDVAANGVTIAASGSGVNTTSFAGAVVAANTYVPDTVTVSGNDLVLEFSDDLNIADTITFLGPIVHGGVETVPPVEDLPLVLNEDGASSSSNIEGFTDYLNEIYTTNFKTYRRGEVYSLGFALVMKNGSVTPAFHIPGKFIDGAPAGESTPPQVAWGNYNIGNSSGDLGTFVSNIEYPSGLLYPPDDPNTPTHPRNIRHHYMPELANEPHFREVAPGQSVIRLISLEFDFNTAIPQNILDGVEEIVFLRENRDVDNNKSVFAQGLINKSSVMCFEYNATSFNGNIEGNDKDSSDISVFGYGATEKENLVMAPGPAFGNIPSILSSLQGDIGKFNGDATKGFVFNQRSDYTPAGEVEDQGMFYSPESILENPFLPSDSLTGYDLRTELSLTSNEVEEYREPDIWRRPNVGSNRYFLDRYLAYGLSGDFNSYNSGAPNVGVSKAIGESRLIQPNSSNSEISTGRLNTDNRYGSQGLEFVLAKDGGANESIVNDQGSSWPLTRVISAPDRNSNSSHLLSALPDVEKYLYNLRLANPTQYASVSLAKYLPIHRAKPVDGGGAFITSYAGVFGGDTFITKFAFINSSTIGYWPFNQWNSNDGNQKNAISYTQDGIPNTTKDSIGEDYPAYINNSEQITWPGGWNFKTNMYFFVESSINTYYRGLDKDENGDLEDNTYFPQNPSLSSMIRTHLSYLGNPDSYNYQYSFDNFVKNYFPLGSTNQALTTFENRTIYSVKAANDDILDTYREFAINDYYDLPAHTGPIWDSFVHQNTFYLHTTKSLWRTQAKETGTLAGGDIEDIVLGQAQLFNQPSLEMTTAEGGHGGTISQYGGIHTEIGYIFPDILQGKIFGLVLGKTTTGVSTGTVLKELSLGAISTDMRNKLPRGIIENNGVITYENVNTDNAHLIDNPFLGIGMSGGFDYRLRRAWLVKHGEEPFTLSYSTIMNNFFSYHDYQPNVIIPYDNRVFFVRTLESGSEMHEMNVGKKGSFFDEKFKSSFEFIAGARVPIATSFTNIQVNSVSRDLLTGIMKRDDNFDTLQVWTDRQNTGVYRLLPYNEKNGYPPSVQPGDLLIKHRNDEYRLAIPRDAVVDNAGDIFDPSNLDQSTSFRERIKETHAHVMFVYDNERKDVNGIPILDDEGNPINMEFVVKMIETKINRNDR